MNTYLYSHSTCLEHDPGSMHPESPARLKAVLDGLEDKKFRFLTRNEAPEIDIELVQMVHQPHYFQSIVKKTPEEGRVSLDPDTLISHKSLESARRASGAAVEAIDRILAGDATNAFCAVRPPGHHAESTKAMGFCLLNGAAIAAFHARNTHHLKRVAVIDFDVHHGNGTQHSFEEEPNLFYGSSHQWPAYPGSGQDKETGCHNNICNVTLAPGTGSLEFRSAYEDKILPALREFLPEFIIISAGFDAHRRDPLAQLNVETDDYRWITEQLLNVAADCCEGRVVSILEGGYDLKALRDSVQAHVGALLEA